MKFLTVIFTVVLAFSAVQAQLPSRLIKNAERSLGGSKLLKNLRSWQLSGTIRRESDGNTGRFVMQTTQPNLFNLSYDLNGFEYEWGFNGRSGWARDSRDGLRTLTGDESVDLQAEAGYRNSLWLRAKQERSKVVAAGPNAIAINTSKGTGIRVVFDPRTGLPVREEYSLGSAKRTFEYSDHRNVGGMLLPFAIKMQLDSEVYDLTVEDAGINRQIARTEFDFPQISGEPLPDIARLLAELQDNEDRVEKILDTYSYVQKSIRRELGKDGVLREVESETFQLSFYKGNRIRRLIEKNGKPLTEREQATEDRSVEKRVEEIERRLAKQEAKANSGPPSENGQRVSIAEVLRASRLVNPRRERFRGRSVIVFDFEPNPAFDYKNAKSMLKFFGKTAGVMWIDEKDKQVARLEAFLADSFNIGGGVLAKLRKGASFTLEQERINDEIWLPSTADVNLSVRVLLVRGINVNQIVRSYDYRKFATEVKSAAVDETKNP